jgi:hypothetical protein
MSPKPRPGDTVLLWEDWDAPSVPWSVHDIQGDSVTMSSMYVSEQTGKRTFKLADKYMARLADVRVHDVHTRELMLTDRFKHRCRRDFPPSTVVWAHKLWASMTIDHERESETYVAASTIPGAGLGLFVAEDLEDGAIVGEYWGPLVRKSKCKNLVYAFNVKDLAYRVHQQLKLRGARADEADPYVIDASDPLRSSALRFVNVNDEKRKSNCRFTNLFDDRLDGLSRDGRLERFERWFLLTTRKVKKGSELLVPRSGYGPNTKSILATPPCTATVEFPMSEALCREYDHAKYALSSRVMLANESVGVCRDAVREVVGFMTHMRCAAAAGRTPSVHEYQVLEMLLKVHDESYCGPKPLTDAELYMMIEGAVLAGAPGLLSIVLNNTPTNGWIRNPARWVADICRAAVEQYARSPTSVNLVAGMRLCDNVLAFALKNWYDDPDRADYSRDDVRVGDMLLVLYEDGKWYDGLVTHVTHVSDASDATDGNKRLRRGGFSVKMLSTALDGTTPPWKVQLVPAGRCDPPLGADWKPTCGVMHWMAAASIPDDDHINAKWVMDDYVLFVTSRW